MMFFIVQNFHSMCQKKHSLGYIKASRYEVLSLFMRSTLLALFFLSFTWLTLLEYETGPISPSMAVESDNSELFPFLLNDLQKEGLFKRGDKSVLLKGGEDDVTVSSYLIETDMLLVSPNDEETQSSVPNETFDFAFVHSHHIDSAEFIDRTLKVGGILTVQLKLQDLPQSFLKHLNYEIVYIRSFEYPIMAMRKTKQKQSLVRRNLLSISEEESKKKALSKLEDVLLEPPRAASRKSRAYLKRTRYLPDLMGEALDLGSYSRRVFVDVGNGKGSSGTEWFVKNYPKRNLKFEIYKIETVNDEKSLGSEQMEITEWLKENLKKEEYVVMKAEADVVEEMMRSNSIKIVDELFLECKPKELGLRGRKMEENKSGRAYWECLALYGKLFIIIFLCVCLLCFYFFVVS